MTLLSHHPKLATTTVRAGRRRRPGSHALIVGMAVADLLWVY
jgi:hypothetical protein